MGVVVALVLLPVLLRALLPLVVIMLLPLIVLGMRFRGAAAPALGCLGSLARSGRSGGKAARPGGVAFRLKRADLSVCEVVFRGRIPRLEFGDEVEAAGFAIGAVLHPLHLRNLTTGERRVSQLAVGLGVAATVTVVLVAGSLG